MHLRGKYKYDNRIYQTQDSFCESRVCENIIIFIHERYVARYCYPITEKKVCENGKKKNFSMGITYVEYISGVIGHT